MYCNKQSIINSVNEYDFQADLFSEHPSEDELPWHDRVRLTGFCSAGHVIKLKAVIADNV